jgi:hypothetical protein
MLQQLHWARVTLDSEGIPGPGRGVTVTVAGQAQDQILDRTLVTTAALGQLLGKINLLQLKFEELKSVVGPS